ncbi:MAG: alpha/beta hydrolase [Methanomassiliicoccales archaeon]|nr:alpha/beta hydrolase [Methanomassiliicoccales archaeon]NYT15976.1 alpha/beta hydrolase [Methanomassiliicoccales archaeon]
MIENGNPRRHGQPPFDIVVVHGGPGAPGEMAPVARELSLTRGVLEPFQIVDSLEGQVEELSSIVESSSDLPAILIGWSWGAWLSLIVAARSPRLISKLILVGSGPFEEKYAASIMRTRMERMGEMERGEVLSIIEDLRDPLEIDKDEKMSRLGFLISVADSFHPVADDEQVEISYDVYQSVWGEAHELRRSGRLLEIAAEVQCPVVAIQGDFDPHPAEGVREPLSRVLRDFRFILLEDCGHKPWMEKMVRDTFFEVLRKEIEG